MSANDWMSSTIEASNRRQKRDRTVFMVGTSLLVIILIGSFSLGALVAWKSEANRSKDHQIFMGRCLRAGFNQQQCGFLSDLRQDERRDADGSAALGSAALGIAASSLAISAGARAGR